MRKKSSQGRDSLSAAPGGVRESPNKCIAASRAGGSNDQPMYPGIDVHKRYDKAAVMVNAQKIGAAAPDRQRWLLPRQGVSKGRLLPYLRAFQLHRGVFGKPGTDPLKTILVIALKPTKNLGYKSDSRNRIT